MSADESTHPRAKPQPTPIPESVIGYGIALLSIIIASFTHTILAPYLGDRLPFIFYFPAVVVAAWYGGLGPAIFTVVFGSLVAILYFMPPTYALAVPRAQDRWELGIYIFVGLATALISESQRRSNQRAMASEQFLKTTLRSIGDAVIATDTDGRVTFMNSVAERLTGWSESDAIATPCGDIFRVVNEATREGVRSPADRALSEGTVVGLANHSVLIARDGAERPIDDSGAPIRNEDGDLLGAVLVFRDISERRAVEHERTRLLEKEQSARAEAEASSSRLSFLSEASRILSASLDYHTTLNQVARLAVPRLADWCAVQVLNEDGKVQRVAVVHPDPAKVELAYEMDRRYPVDPNAPRGTPHVMRTGETEVYPEVPDEILEQSAQDPEHLRIARELGLKSALIVPLLARGRTLGVITLIYAESDRRYTAEDQTLAEELARRAGAAVDNARLYSEAQAALAASAEAVRLHQFVEEKLTLLTEATGALIGSLDQESVLQGVIHLAGRLVGADAYAIWRMDDGSGQWRTAASRGLSEKYQREVVELLDHSTPAPERVMAIADLENEPIMSRHQDLLHSEGFRSLLVLPLDIGGAISGTLVFYHRAPHQFGSTELKIAGALANIAASAITTAELYQELWQRADELAQEDRRKNQFLAMLAHELRNPIHAINNAAEVLETAAPATDAFRRSLDVVSRQTRHMSYLVNDLLDVSRISRGKIKIQIRRLDLAALIEATVEDHRAIFQTAGLSLSLEIKSRPLWIDGDPTRLRQIVGNLLQNAAKYTNSGGSVCVRAGLDETEAPGPNMSAVGESSGSPEHEKSETGGKMESKIPMVKVEVQDTGIGINPEILPQLFEPFVQADRSLDRTQGGLGLGLALVKGIVERHGGHAGAFSEGHDKGSLFHFTIPEQPAPVDTAPASVPAVDGDQPLSILIIEDNPDASETLRDLLELLGHQVTVATSGPTGVEEARRTRPDAVLCDIGLPGMNGYAVAAALRKDPDTASASIIAISGYTRTAASPHPYPDEFDVHLTKPIDPLQLKEILASVKDNGKVSSERD
ncbi:MAG TPA: GAF domain-containing protein [Armatimonadota bacterium]|nr:GAF domain-containing protein [Armatimonadota bacterium]